MYHEASVTETIVKAFDHFAKRLDEEASWILGSGTYPSDEEEAAASKALDKAADCARSTARELRNGHMAVDTIVDTASDEGTSKPK